jgi:hypothetical protein
MDKPKAETKRGKAPRARGTLWIALCGGALLAAAHAHAVDVWVEAEISNCKVWNTGHMYFTLKDEQAQGLHGVTAGGAPVCHR